MLVEGVGILCSMESEVQTSPRVRSPSPSYGKVKKGYPEAPETTAAHAFWEEGGHGVGGKTANLRFGFFVQNFLPKFKKNLSLMFKHLYLVCLLSWITPLPFRLEWL
jgi:hypothetical protein